MIEENLSKNVCTIVKNIESNNIIDALKTVLSLLNKDFNNIHLDNDYNNEFENNYFFDILTSILENYSLNWLSTNDNRISINELLNQCILSGPNEESFLCLVTAIKNVNDALIKVQLIKHLKILLEKKCIEKVIIKYCKLFVTLKSSEGTTSNEIIYFEELNLFNQTIVSLPDIVITTNSLIDNTFFYPKDYMKLIGSNILSSLQYIYSCIQSNKDSSVIPISKLMCKINSTGNSPIIWEFLINKLFKDYEISFLWQRILQKLIYNIDDLSICSIIKIIIKNVPDFYNLNALFGLLPIKKTSIETAFEKLIVYKYTTNDITNKLLLYIGYNDKLFFIFTNIFIKLIELWSNANGIKRRSVEHSLYICKHIALCIAIIKKKNLKILEYKDVITKYLLEGVPNYLSSLNNEIQEMGMFIAEKLSTYAEGSTNTLNFEIKSTNISEELINNMIIIERNEKTAEKNSDTIINSISDSCQFEPKMPNLIANTEIDSDDELPAFVTENRCNKNQPKYLSDCLNILLTSDDANSVSECLKCIKSLIEDKSEDSSEVSVELCKTLLYLEDKFALDNYIQLRHQAMVAITTAHPLPIAHYLTSQLFLPEFSIRHRLDILEVISSAAVNLSSLKKIDKHFESQQPSSESLISTNELTWREIIDDRIKKKTRYFCSSKSSHEKPQFKNNFAKISGNFFYPLIKDFDSNTKCLDILGQDYLVAQKLLYTLASVINCSVNSPDVGRMANTLIEFSMCFKDHQETGVIMSILCCLGSALLSLNEGLLLPYIENTIDEMRLFIMTILKKDNNTECTKLASEILILLNQTIYQYATKT